VKIPPRTRKTIRYNGASSIEQTARERIPRVDPPKVNANITITSEEEEMFNRIIGKMEATL
jgi:hypothetical protein